MIAQAKLISVQSRGDQNKNKTWHSLLCLLSSETLKPKNWKPMMYEYGITQRVMWSNRAYITAKLINGQFSIK